MKIKAKKYKRNDFEHEHQKAFFDAISYYPDIRHYTFAVPNGGHRRPWVAKKLKDEGVTKGVADVICLIPIAPYHGLLIEFKYGNNKLTLEQTKFKELIEAKGYKFIVAYHWEKALQSLMLYIKGEHGV